MASDDEITIFIKEFRNLMKEELNQEDVNKLLYFFGEKKLVNPNYCVYDLVNILDSFKKESRGRITNTDIILEAFDRAIVKAFRLNERKSVQNEKTEIDLEKFNEFCSYSEKNNNLKKRNTIPYRIS